MRALLYTLGCHGHSVATIAIYSLPDPVMRRIDLEYCQIDSNNGTHWHAKRQPGQPQLQLEDCRDDTSCISFGDNIQASDKLLLHTSLQACLMSPANGQTCAGKTWFEIYSPSGLGLRIFAAMAPMKREGTSIKKMDSTSMEKTSMANLLPLDWSVSGMISLNT